MLPTAYTIEYLISVEGYKDISFTLAESEQQVKLPKLFYEYDGTNMTVSGTATMGDADVSITATQPTTNYVGNAKLNGEFGTEVLFEATLKMSNTEDGWTGHSTQQRFALQVTESGKGFMFWAWHDGADKTNIRSLVSLTSGMEEGPTFTEQKEVEMGWIYAALTGGEGLGIRIVRENTSIKLILCKDGDWVQVAELTCEENDSTVFGLYGMTANYTYSDITVSQTIA